MEESRNYTDLLQQVTAGQMSRRGVLKRAMLLGLSAPAIAALLAACGEDDEDDSGSDSPTSTPASSAPEATDDDAEEDDEAAETPEDGVEETPDDEDSGESTGQGRGEGDLLRLLYWQAPTILNPHFAQGDKDNHASRIVLEPLVNTDSDGNLQPVLAAEIPTIENGGVSEDGLSVTYKLKEGVLWSDGEPFTAEDVRFTWEFATNQESTAVTFSIYSQATDVEVVDDYTVRLVFDEPNPAWIQMFAGTFGGQILPKHILEEYMGASSREAPFNLNPIGTGPYKVAEFRPGDVVLYEVNENYREPDKPYFRQVELKGGGDAVSAARAVAQLGETDYSWNLQIEKDVLDQLQEQATEGTILTPPGNSVEQVFVNFADPYTEVDGARSEPSTEHPFFSDKRVREALKLASDRETIAVQLYGDAGQPTANTLVSPSNFASPNTVVEFDPEAAAALLDEAGWVMDGGVRKKDGQELSILFTSTVATIRQRTQEVLKQAWEEIGFRVEIKAIDASVYFSSDAGNPDTVAHFYADLTMFTNGPISPYPIDYMSSFISIDPASDLSQKANNWSGGNYMRWVNEEFNELWTQASSEMDPEKQAELFIQMNDLVVDDVARIGLVHRSTLNGFANRIKGHEYSRWEGSIYDIANWYAEE